MLVMLLWAITLPGQEAEVYSFLFNGSIHKASSNLVSGPVEEGKGAVKQQPIQVFLDARTSSTVVLNQQQLAIHPVWLLAFAVPTDEALPAYAVNPAGRGLLAQLFPVTILAKAP